MCLVFEPLGKSLFDFIKDNGYKGFEICQVREIAMQSLQAIEFLHSIKLTHTDLKPENILLKSNAQEIITDERQFPIVSDHHLLFPSELKVTGFVSTVSLAQTRNLRQPKVQ